MTETPLTIREFLDHESAYDGYCTACGEWTAGGVEPDAENYQCECCDQHTVVGAQQAFITDAITVAGD